MTRVLEELNYWIKRQKIWIEIAALVVSVLVLVAIARQTSEIAKSAEATKVAAETARQQLRATTAPIVNFSVEPTGNAGVQWLEPGIQNCGHGMAEEATVDFDKETISLITGQQIGETQHFTLPKQPLDLGSGGGCGHKESEQIGISDIDLQALTSLEQTIKISGSFGYSDGFETFHREFCYSSLPQNWVSGDTKTGRPPGPGQLDFVECGVFDVHLSALRKQKQAVEQEWNAQLPSH
jgi:hypothetical protein